jgi:hypothetical protein
MLRRIARYRVFGRAGGIQFGHPEEVTQSDTLRPSIAAMRKVHSITSLVLGTLGARMRRIPKDGQPN